MFRGCLSFTLGTTWVAKPGSGMPETPWALVASASSSVSDGAFGWKVEKSARKRKKHGAEFLRQWRKAHLSIDANNL